MKPTITRETLAELTVGELTAIAGAAVKLTVMDCNGSLPTLPVDRCFVTPPAPADA